MSGVRLRGGSLPVALLAAIALCAAYPLCAQGAWESAVELGVPESSPEGGGSLSSISCTAAGSCDAVGRYDDPAEHLLPMAMSKRGSVWGAPQRIALPPDANSAEPSGYLQRISCSAPGWCAAYGLYRNTEGFRGQMVVSEIEGVWGRASDLAFPEGASFGGQESDPTFIESISCAGPDDCSVVGQYLQGGNQVQQAMLATSLDGIWQSRATRIESPQQHEEATPPAQLRSVSCWAPGSCTAVGSYTEAAHTRRSMAITESGGSWSPASSVPVPSGRRVEWDMLEAVTCFDAGDCVAVGQLHDEVYAYGMASTESRGTWQQGIELAPPPGSEPEFVVNLERLACTDMTSCAAAGFQGVETAWMAAEAGGRWAGLQRLAAPEVPTSGNSHTTISSIACLPSSACTEVGEYERPSSIGQAFLETDNGGAWDAQASLVAPPGDATPGSGDSLNSISCSPAGTCDAVGGYRSAAVGNLVRPMSISLNEPPPAPPSGAPLASTSYPTPARTAAHTVATSRAGGDILELIGPRECVALTSHTTFRLRSRPDPRARTHSKLSAAALYLDGGIRRRVLVATRPHRRWKVKFEPQLRRRGSSATFTFVPVRLHAHRGANAVVVSATLVRRFGKGTHGVSRVTRLLRSVLPVC